MHKFFLGLIIGLIIGTVAVWYTPLPADDNFVVEDYSQSTLPLSDGDPNGLGIPTYDPQKAVNIMHAR